MKLAHIGIGNWGKNFIEKWKKLGVLCAVCDNGEKRLHEFAISNPDIKAILSYDEILSSNDIDAVSIATPAPMHYDMAVAAMLHGKHVFVEKPMALSVNDAAVMTEIASDAKVKLMVGHIMLYNNCIDYIKKVISSGEIGDILHCHMRRTNFGRIRADENVVWSVAPHDISMLVHMIGVPTQIDAFGYDYVRPGIDDVAFARFGFNGKVSATLQLSWLDPDKTRSFTIIGTKKMITFDDVEKIEKIKIHDKHVNNNLSLTDAGTQVPILTPVEPLEAECSHFVDCVVNDKRPLTDGVHGLEVIKILSAIDDSIKAKRPKPIDKA